MQLWVQKIGEAPPILEIVLVECVDEVCHRSKKIALVECVDDVCRRSS